MSAFEGLLRRNSFVDEGSSLLSTVSDLSFFSLVIKASFVVCAFIFDMIKLPFLKTWFPSEASFANSALTASESAS